MAGQAGRRDTGRTGRTDERSTSGRSRAARQPEFVPQPIEFEEQARPGEAAAEETRVSVEAPLAPDIMPRTVRTQASYRLLTATGLTGAEAAGVIGYVVGLYPGQQPWTLEQVNKMLFLRELYSSGEWAKAERRPA
jgi:hypothetical protein